MKWPNVKDVIYKHGDCLRILLANARSFYFEEKKLTLKKVYDRTFVNITIFISNVIRNRLVIF